MAGNCLVNEEDPMATDINPGPSSVKDPAARRGSRVVAIRLAFQRSIWLRGPFRGHSVARVGTAATQLGTLFHDLVISSNAVAIACALPTEFGTEATGPIMS